MRQNKFLEKVLTARVYDIARETPLDHMDRISQRFHNKVWLKREDLQPVFSFKCRGAFNKIFQELQRDPKLKGVITASAGNHAQGVALSARKLGLKSTIVMPVTTPDIKVSAVKSFGGKAVLHGENFDAARDHALNLAKKEKLAFIHPYDDFDVMAGQGTIAHEIIRQHPDQIDMVFVPVGGGGLASGIAGFLKAVNPKIKIIAVEPADAASFYEARRKGRRVVLKEVGIFADGVAVKQVGKHTFGMLRELVDDAITVTTDQICAAIKDTFEDTRAICEPAGAVSLAGLKKYVESNGVKGQTLVAINSGANMNFDRLRHVSERAELGEEREALLAVEIPEQPGSFKKLCQLIGNRSITEFNYRYADDNEAQVFAGIQLKAGGDGRDELVGELRAAALQLGAVLQEEGRARVADLDRQRLLQAVVPAGLQAVARVVGQVRLESYQGTSDAIEVRGVRRPRLEGTRLRRRGVPDQRLLNWKRRRALRCPYFLRSTMRPSRVR